MKKVRVERELPFAKVGKEFEQKSSGGLWIYKMGKITVLLDTIDEWIKDGWLSWVEEEKSLEEKYSEINRTDGHYSYTAPPSKLAQIAKDHYREKFDKAIKSNTYMLDTRAADNIHKAMFGEDV